MYTTLMVMPHLYPCNFAEHASEDDMVEAGGVEPPSEKRYGLKTTCLAQFSLFRPQRSE